MKNSKGGELPLYLQSADIRRQRLEKQEREVRVKEYVQNYCYNYDFKFRNIKVLSYKKTNIQYGRGTKRLQIPNEIRVEMVFDIEQQQVVYADYIFDKFLQAGSFGSVFKFRPKRRDRGISGIALKIMLSPITDKDIEERIIPELEVSADIELSECKIINSINFELNNPNYSLYPNDENYFIYLDNESRVALSIVAMPLADGDIFDILGNLKMKQKKKIFLYVVQTLLCVIQKNRLVYPDIKLEQILFMNCKFPDGTKKLIFIVADLGGFQTPFSYPVHTNSPSSQYINANQLNSLQLSLYPVAALWHDLFSYEASKKKLDLYSRYNKFGLISDSELNQLVERNLGRVTGLEQQREIVKELLIKPDFKNTNFEKVTLYLSKLISSS